MKRENQFRSRLKADVKKFWGRKAYVQLHHGSQFSSGLPDMLVVLDGAAVFVELKAVEDLPGQGVAFDFMRQPTVLQLHTLNEIEAAGMKAVVCVYYHAARLVQVVPADVVGHMRVNRKTVLTVKTLMDGHNWGTLGVKPLAEIEHDALALRQLLFETCPPWDNLLALMK